MKTSRRQICVIGLGHFGSSLARSLRRRCEVIALDNDINRVNAIADSVERALCVDGRDYASLSSVVSSGIDEAVVSIGGNLEASILCTLHLKRIGVPVIRAKATSSDHAAILKSVGADHIVFPEQETAERLALQMTNPNLIDWIPLARDYLVVNVTAPTEFVGLTLAQLQIRNRYGLFVIAVRKGEGESFEFLPGPNHVIVRDDVLVVIGRESDVVRLRAGFNGNGKPPAGVSGRGSGDHGGREPPPR